MSPSPSFEEDLTIRFTTVKKISSTSFEPFNNIGIFSLSQVFFPSRIFLRILINDLWIDVSLPIYKKIKAEREARGQRIRFFYLQNELHITMPTLPHERAHTNL